MDSTAALADASSRTGVASSSIEIVGTPRLVKRTETETGVETLWEYTYRIRFTSVQLSANFSIPGFSDTLKFVESPSSFKIKVPGLEANTSPIAAHSRLATIASLYAHEGRIVKDRPHLTHTDARHIKIDFLGLQERLKKGYPKASMFYNREIAELAISLAVDLKKKKISDWLAKPEKGYRLPLQCRLDSNVGCGFLKEKKEQLVHSNVVKVVLLRQSFDPEIAGLMDLNIETAFPLI